MTVKTVTMTEGIPLVSKSGLRELILVAADEVTYFPDWSLIYMQQQSSTNQYTSNSNAIAISF